MVEEMFQLGDGSSCVTREVARVHQIMASDQGVLVIGPEHALHVAEQCLV